MLSGFVRTAHQLYAVRFLLGLAEAGYFPGIVLYLTYWFRQRQLAQTVALFMTANPVANIIGAPFSGMILDNVHWLGLSSWRWLLILEGVPAIVGGALTYFLLPSRPAEAKFLTPEERDWITTELSREERQKLAAGQVTAGQALMDGRVWHLTAIYFAEAVGFYSMIFWMPQFVKNLSSQYSNTTVGLLVMISVSRRAASNDPRRPKLGSKAGAAIPRCYSTNDCSCLPDPAGYEHVYFSFPFGHPLVSCCVGHFLSMGSILVAAE